MRNIETRNLAAATELRAAGAHVVELDVTDEASVDTAMANAVEFAGSIDAVVNNAGVGSIGLLETFTPADWQAIFDINVFGVQRVNRAALPTTHEPRLAIVSLGGAARLRHIRGGSPVTAVDSAGLEPGLGHRRGRAHRPRRQRP